MRIVQLANFHGPQSGGIRTSLREWRTGYVARGHETHLITPGATTSLTEEPEGGIVHTLTSPRIPWNDGYRIILDRSRVVQLLGRIRPDVVEVSDRTTLIGLGLWARENGIKSALVLHERLDHQIAHLLPAWAPSRRLVDYWNRRTAAGFESIVATSTYGAREMLRVGLRPRHVALGVDLEVFRPLGAPSAKRVARLVFLGRLSREKRPDLALRALGVLLGWGIDAELVFVGEGPMRPSLAEAARGLPVSFTGFVDDRHHVSSLLAGADVSVVPCPGECFGLAALESMACGVPVVVAANSGAAELVEEGGGLAVPPGPRGFARAIESILESPMDMGSRAREIAERYSWDESVSAMLAVHGEPVTA